MSDPQPEPIATDGAGTDVPAPEALIAEDPAQPAGATTPAAEPAEAAQAGDAVSSELEELRARAAERDEFLALAQRTQADFENYRKRMAREARLAQDRGVRKVVSELLPALDNLERAIAAAEAQEGDEEHHMTKGIRLVQEELAGALTRIGIEPFSPKGEPFDPTEHEAMAQHSVEGATPGTVLEVLQQGYRMTSGVTIRPARVVVAA